MDPHIPTPDGQAQVCPDGRTVLYIAGNLTTAVGEVFGDYPVASICPQYRVALLRPRDPIAVLDLRSQGAAMRVGALPSLATGAYPRARTQEWARAIYEDQPARRTRHGVYYEAAHSAGPALALWGRDAVIEHVSDSGGMPQDFALNAPRMWPRIVAAAHGLGIQAATVAGCPICAS